MASTAVVGSLMAGESAFRAMSATIRNANSGSCSIVRSEPDATVVCRRRSSIAAAPP